MVYRWLEVLSVLHSEYRDGQVSILPATQEMVAALADIQTRLVDGIHVVTDELVINMERVLGSDVAHVRHNTQPCPAGILGSNTNAQVVAQPQPSTL